MRRLVATALFALLTLAAPAAAQDTHRHSGNMRHIANLPYEARNGTTANYGTDIEFARLAGKQYALGGLVPQRHADRRHLAARAGADRGGL